MTDKQFHFILEGSASEKAREALQAILQRELALREDDFQISELQELKRDQQKMAVDPIALTALVLSIPSAVLATWDLIKRAQKKKELDRILAEIRQLLKENPRLSLRLQMPDGSILELNSLNTPGLLDAAALDHPEDSSKGVKKPFTG